jgi:DNA-binding protein Fis
VINLNQLKYAVRDRKAYIIERLINMGFTKGEDGCQLYELSLSELEHHYIDIRIHQAKQTPITQVMQ